MHAGVDWSNFQPIMTPKIANSLRDLGVFRVSAQTQFDDVFQACANACVQAHIGLDAVRYIYPSQDASQQVQQAIASVEKAKTNYGAITRRIELDLEQEKGSMGLDWVSIINQCLEAGKGYKVSIYTSPQWWENYLSNSNQFNSLPLRVALWNNLAALPLVGFGGWERADAIQYSQGINILDTIVNPNVHDDTDLGG